MIRHWCLLLFLSTMVFVGCNKSLQPSKATFGYYQVKNSLYTDTSIVNYIQPYKDSLELEMNDVLAVSSLEMPKGSPESLMGNLVADLVLEQSRAYSKGKVDVAILNSGGLRIPGLPKGEITRGKIYELMPFDNFLVILEIKGEILKKLADEIATRGGWPIAGMQIQISEDKATSILINGELLNFNQDYRIAISDYLADGGDKLFYLKNEKRENLGIFLRDAIIEYFEEKGNKDILITSQLDGRITRK